MDQKKNKEDLGETTRRDQRDPMEIVMCEIKVGNICCMDQGVWTEMKSIN